MTAQGKGNIRRLSVFYLQEKVVSPIGKWSHDLGLRESQHAFPELPGSWSDKQRAEIRPSLTLCFTGTSFIGHSVLSHKAWPQTLVIQGVRNQLHHDILGLGHSTDTRSLVSPTVLRFCMEPIPSMISQCFFIVDDGVLHALFGECLETLLVSTPGDEHNRLVGSG